MGWHKVAGLIDVILSHVLAITIFCYHFWQKWAAIPAHVARGAYKLAVGHKHIVIIIRSINFLEHGVTVEKIITIEHGNDCLIFARMHCVVEIEERSFIFCVA